MKIFCPYCREELTSSCDYENGYLCGRCSIAARIDKFTHTFTAQIVPEDNNVKYVITEPRIFKTILFTLLLIILLLLTYGCGTFPKHQNSFIGATVTSYHSDRNRSTNEQNLGLHMQHNFSDVFTRAGWYNNSQGRTSRYIMLGREKRINDNLSYGIMGGVITGYIVKNDEPGPLPVIFPYIKWKNIEFIPLLPEVIGINIELLRF